MRQLVALLITFLVLLVPADGPAMEKNELLPMERDGLWGYVNEGGRFVIEPTYLMAMDFTEGGIAAVVDEEGWVYINQRGEHLIRPFIFDNGPDYFHEGLARFIKNNKAGFFDIHGIVVIEPAFDFASPFSEGFAVVCMGCRRREVGEHFTVEGGRYGFIDRTGSIVIPIVYDFADIFSDGKARVQLNNKWFYINSSGDTVPTDSDLRH